MGGPIASPLEGYTDETLKALGTLVVSAGRAESILAVLATQLLQHPKPATDLMFFGTAGTATRPRLKQIRDLVALHGLTDDLKRLGKLCNHIETAFERRNDIIHGYPGPPTVAHNIYTVNSVRLVKDGNTRRPERQRHYSPDDIYRTARKVLFSTEALRDVLILEWGLTPLPAQRAAYERSRPR